MNVILTDIHHGSKAQGRDHLIYAHVRNADGDGGIIISATLDYCLARIQERGWQLVKEEKK